MTDWRDLTELPHEGDRVLTSSNSYVTIGTREGDEWFNVLGQRLVQVDHWAPIPRGATDSLGVKYPTGDTTARLKKYEAALFEIARLRTELRGDFSRSSQQSDIARKALGGVEQMP